MSEQSGRLAAGVLLPGFIGTSPPGWLVEAIGDGLAGVVYFGHNIADQAQLAALSSQLHALRAGLLIAVDEEGGDVTRLHVGAGSSHPGHAALGVVDDLAATAAVAGGIGRELRTAGVDLNLAPCVDVNSDPANPVIGVRSFGSDPRLVARHAAAFVEGLQEAGVAACAKHFPGHGGTRTDSHVTLPVIDADLATLRARDLPPFASAIAAGARCVLTAHIRFTAVDSAPATVSPAVTALLRDELGFDGVVLTDALDMRAITARFGLAGGAVAALAAGADLLCIGNPANEAGRGDGRAELDLVWRAIVDAVRTGELPEQRLREANARVAELAGWVRAAKERPVPALPPTLGLEVARRALRVTGDVLLAGPPEVVDLRRHVNRAAGRNSAVLLDVLHRRAPAGAGAGRPVVLVDEPQRDPAVTDELHALLHRHPGAVVVATGWPDPSVDLGGNVVRTFGNARVNAEAAADVLFGSVGA
ncbi:MAG TPA: beta-N-acetylhexosaminidase [Pseudonocardiaceae bacterium]|nr:beta-N-acetylhexosaminidase [Pseudonocardiaceae bacterium]